MVLAVLRTAFRSRTGPLHIIFLYQSCTVVYSFWAVCVCVGFLPDLPVRKREKLLYCTLLYSTGTLLTNRSLFDVSEKKNRFVVRPYLGYSVLSNGGVNRQFPGEPIIGSPLHLIYGAGCSLKLHLVGVPTRTGTPHYFSLTIILYCGDFVL
jgi:hypothetical protein